MTHWSWVETSVPAIVRRLALLLALVAGYCIMVEQIIRTAEMKAPNWGSAAGLVNTIALGLLMGFRNRLAHDRWWEGRKLWGQLVNDSRNLAAKLAAFLPRDVLLQSRVGEKLVSFADALNRHLRDEAPKLREFAGFEQESADPTHVPNDITCRLYAPLAEWHRAGRIDQAVLWVLDAHLRGLLDVCGACERIRNTPPLPSYRSLLRAGLVLNVGMVPWLMIPEIGLWGVPAIVVACFFLLGVELIDTVIEEPFGREREDLDLDRYCRTIRDAVYASLPVASKGNA